MISPAFNLTSLFWSCFVNISLSSLTSAFADATNVHKKVSIVKRTKRVEHVPYKDFFLMESSLLKRFKSMVLGPLPHTPTQCQSSNNRSLEKHRIDCNRFFEGQFLGYSSFRIETPCSKTSASPSAVSRSGPNCSVESLREMRSLQNSLDLLTESGTPEFR